MVSWRGGDRAGFWILFCQLLEACFWTIPLPHIRPFPHFATAKSEFAFTSTPMPEYSVYFPFEMSVKPLKCPNKQDALRVFAGLFPTGGHLSIVNGWLCEVSDQKSSVVLPNPPPKLTSYGVNE